MPHYFGKMTETEYLEFENMRVNANISPFQKETFRQANFGVNIHRDLIDGRPGKVVYHISVAGIRFAISEDSAHSIISEIQRLGLLKERDKTELNPEEHAEFLGLIKDMEEMKEAVNELIKERNEEMAQIFKEAFEEGYTAEDFKAVAEILKRTRQLM